ncbi:SAM-dependent methyltransferase [Labilibaculum sp. A4]|uniref:SAM-dependent methyltransferase n=1 Tax=Labilibaculum euxinus TaxID=2686357 RepID=A0A425YEA0_9BACT|nr:SAM-dependent methyltransferase [Labilibaculum euxinus]MDQ1772081.1 SAM-dependent methyltransferase [Labilibaculum euxinus]MUP39588.1 SAM-dependent methyltransferase [Labilibaculum euxinus]MVB08793.1 SAM-dependent methyltransferase [Labilibaculum euxinus]MWN75577.1 SAM-dependent methyltransferase [Labilibaculum euxinus]
MKGKLFLIPTTLGDTEIDQVIPNNIQQLIPDIKHFIVENIRTTRRYLKKVNQDINIDDLTFYELNKHTSPKDISTYLDAIADHDMGIISEAGCPGVADPGADVVKIAHTKNIQVVPLVGPSSILLSLMASGFNGQNFAFNGYLPIPSNERSKKIKHLDHRSLSEGQTQMFIETPFRNMKMLEDLLQNCSPATKLCIAADITLESEYIKTMSVQAWKNNLPDLHKRPAIFLIHREK